MNLPRLLRTVRHLKPVQIAWRIWFPLIPRRPGKPPAVSCREPVGAWIAPVAKRPEMEGHDAFNILNQPIGLESARSWNDPSQDKLLLYHLHYMNDLSADGAADRADRHAELMDRWIAENPPPAGNGWEPYPLSLRIVNWIKWALAGNALTPAQLESLWIQARILNQTVEYHLQANHLLANAKGLFFAGAFFNGDEPLRWLGKGKRILSDQVGEQILPDGGHFERSPMYQAVVLEDLLDVVNAGRTFAAPVPAGIDTLVVPMLDWLACMTHPDGEPAYFNDTVAANGPSLADLQAYAARLGFEAATARQPAGCQLTDSGYWRYRGNAFDLIFDAGPIGPDFQPGHAHCDCLSFELSVDGARVFVNMGVSTYNDDGRRHAERGTAAHNTVSIDGLEQSEIWGAFRVGRRARPVDVRLGATEASGGHDGYRRQGIVHRRRVEAGTGGITIHDLLESRRATTGHAHFHCHPALEPKTVDGTVAAGPVRLSFENARQVRIMPYEYCLGFNHRVPAKKIVVDFETQLTTEIRRADPVP